MRALRSAPPPLAAAHLLVLRLELVVVRREGARPRATAGALGGGAAGVRAPRVAGGEGGREAGEAEERRVMSKELHRMRLGSNLQSCEDTL